MILPVSMASSHLVDRRAGATAVESRGKADLTFSEQLDILVRQEELLCYESAKTLSAAGNSNRLEVQRRHQQQREEVAQRIQDLIIANTQKNN
mmetsp:Transcript_14603/g.41690  ORF Transcript_14603/g.41690 Transcript_14603/m.41690 type:complete len:93 (-) Transcript_14603:2022-2300(-)